jgi:type I restriction enzyme S subunit
MIPEGWSQVELQDLALVERGKFSARPRNDPKYYGGETPFVQTGDVASANTYLSNYSQSLNDLGVTVSKVFPAGTILITIAANIGDTAITTFDVACPDSVVAIQPHPEKANAFWLKMHLETLRKELDNKATQNAQKNINLQIIKPLKILLPPRAEQQKIAQILSTWDKAIATTEQLLANSEQQKKALMQQLLTGKKRLPGFGRPGTGGFSRKGIPDDWSYERIGNVAEEVADRNKEQEELPVLSCSKYDGFVDSLKYFKKKVYSDDTSNYKLIRCGEFGFPANHVEEGSIGLQSTHDKGIVSPIYVVFRVDPSRIAPFFLYKILKSDHYRQIFAASTSASVDRRGSLRWKQFSSIKVPLPSIEEQKAISRVIQLAEKEEKLLEHSLDRLRSKKKALMRQLLTGKRRVRIGGAE